MQELSGTESYQGFRRRVDQKLAVEIKSAQRQLEVGLSRLSVPKMCSVPSAVAATRSAQQLGDEEGLLATGHDPKRRGASTVSDDGPAMVLQLLQVSYMQRVRQNQVQ